MSVVLYLAEGSGGQGSGVCYVTTANDVLREADDARYDKVDTTVSDTLADFLEDLRSSAGQVVNTIEPPTIDSQETKPREVVSAKTGV